MRSHTRRARFARTLAHVVRSSLVLLGFALLPASALAVPPVNFPDGVASGEVRPRRAVLWTRVDRQTPLKVEVSVNPVFTGRKVLRRRLHPSAADDFAVRVLVRRLAPGTTYYYRFRHGSAKSPVGTFRTAPHPGTAADVSFAWSGDSDALHQFVDGNLFQLLDGVRAEPLLDFFIYLGDTIYSDSSLRRPLLGLGPATTLDDYRDVYRMNRALPALRDLLGSVGIYAVTDDHEVQDDYDGQTVDPVRYANGREAFLEYMPLREVGLPEDATCAGDPLFRVFHWGSNVDVFVLDERSCRSADAQAACVTSPLTVDFAPTLPPLQRQEFRAQLLGAGVTLAQVDLLLPALASPACLAAVLSPARTVLGPVQKKALKKTLQASTAPFKVIVNQYPIQQFWALPYDRWEGYAAERAELLAFIRDFVSGHVLFATTDTHANLVNTQVAVDRFVTPLPVATEVVTGPIATFTFEQELAGFATVLGVPPAFVVGAFHRLLTLGGVQCRNLDTDSYARVDVSAAMGTAVIDLKDAGGNLVPNADPLDPLNTAPCTLVIGP